MRNCGTVKPFLKSYVLSLKYHYPIERQVIFQLG